MQKEDVLKHYAVLKAQEKKVQKEIEEIQKQVLSIVEEEGGKVETTLGNFSVTSKPAYIFPDYIIKKREDLKIEEHNLIKSNTLDVKWNKFITFKGIK